MKNLNIVVAILFFIMFLLEKAYEPTKLTWVWFILGLLNLAEWIRYRITQEIKEFINTKIK